MPKIDTHEVNIFRSDGRLWRDLDRFIRLLVKRLRCSMRLDRLLFERLRLFLVQELIGRLGEGHLGGIALIHRNQPKIMRPSAPVQDVLVGFRVFPIDERRGRRGFAAGPLRNRGLYLLHHVRDAPVKRISKTGAEVVCLSEPRRMSDGCEQKRVARGRIELPTP
jgi:hypothetical protein